MITLYKMSRTTQTLLRWSIWREGRAVYTEWTTPRGSTAQSNVSTLPTPELASRAMSAAITTKRRRGYAETLTTNRPIEAMLANKYNPNSRVSKQFPYFTQPKYDGIRCLYCSKARKLYSRTTREIVAFPSLLSLLNSHNFPSLDGELYSHALSLEQINSYVSRSVNIIDDPSIMYMVYDMPVPDLTQTQRLVALEAFFNKPEIATIPRIKWSEYHVVHTHANVLDRHADYVSRGYEGLILRHIYHPYRFGTRSSSLLKLKIEQDDYFPIHKLTSDKKGNPIFTLRSPNGLFNAVIEGTDEERKRHLANAKNLVGRQAHVRFMCLTDLGIPRHARIVTIES